MSPPETESGTLVQKQAIWLQKRGLLGILQKFQEISLTALSFTLTLNSEVVTRKGGTSVVTSASWGPQQPQLVLGADIVICIISEMNDGSQ